MKVKSIGKVPPSDPPQDNRRVEAEEEFFELSGRVKKKSKLPFFIGGGILLLVVVGLVLYFTVIKEESNDLMKESDETMSSDELKKRELELKEKELELREKQLKGSNNTGINESSNNNNIAETEVEAANQVKKWINALGSRDYSTAYYMMDGKQRGSYSKFTSTGGYGGITSTSIFNCYVDNSYGCSAEVVADYESIDPYNKSGRYKQRFFINNCDGYWKITALKNVSINYY